MASARAVCHFLQRRHLMVLRSLYYGIIPNVQCRAWCSTKKPKITVEPKKAKNKVPVGVIQVENTLFIGLIAVGVGIFVVAFYVLYKELLSSKGPTVIYNKAVDRCLEHSQVVDLLGAPIRAHGSGRRRKQHIHRTYYVKDGVSYMQLVFYLQGTRRRATVLTEMRENASGDYEYSYLHVMVDNIGTIVVEDNRNSVKT